MSLGVEFIYWDMEGKVKSGKGRRGKKRESEREKRRERKERDGSTERGSNHLFRRGTRKRDS